MAGLETGPQGASRHLTGLRKNRRDHRMPDESVRPTMTSKGLHFSGAGAPPANRFFLSPVSKGTQPPAPADQCTCIGSPK